MGWTKVSPEWEELHYPLPPYDDDFGDMMNTPIVNLRYCEFDKKRKILKLASEYFGMPSKFFVQSDYTNKRVLFVPVVPGDALFDPDGWDGEQQIYRPVVNIPNVDHMVIYHAW